MKLSSKDLSKLAEAAKAAALEASVMIAEYAQKEVKVSTKEGMEGLASQVVTEVDHLSQEIIINRLKPVMTKYDLGLLTEESEDNGSRFEKDHFWCIDPMDGTLAFTEKRPGYSVSIGLVSREGISQVGVITNPVNQDVYHAIRGGKAYKNNQDFRIAIPEGDVFTLVTDRGFLKNDLFQSSLSYLREQIKKWGYNELKLIDTGGAAMNACWVLENAPACYFKFPKERPGGGSLWDYAASACIFKEAGAWVTDMFGNDLDLNRKSFFMNDCGILYSTGEKIAGALRDFYRDHHSA